MVHLNCRRGWWIGVLCSAGIGAGAQAAVNSDFLEMSLEELVDYRLMSMSRKEQRVADMAAAAYVVTAEEIRRSGALSVPEALRLVPGLNVAQIAANRWAVTARGFNERFAAKLLVLVDGRTIYSAAFSGVLWETQDLVMEDIERIEVIRGPGAALWGTNAMNGVINIVTRSAANSQGDLTSSTVGTGGLSSVSVRHGAELANGGHYKVYGKQTLMGASPQYGSGLDSNDTVRQQRLGVRFDPDVSGGKLSLLAEVYQNRSNDIWNIPTLLPYSDPGTPYLRASRLTTLDQGSALQARYAWRDEQGAENVWQAYVDHESSKHHADAWGSGTAINGGPIGQPVGVGVVGGDKTDVDLDFQQRRVWGEHDFIWGVNLRHTTDDLSLPAGPYLLIDRLDRRMNYSAFVHDEWSWIPDRLKLIMGSKFEHDGLTGWNIQPNVRTLYTPNANEAYWAALSRSVRSPRRTQSFATADVAADDAASVLAKYGIGGIPASVLTVMQQFSPQSGAKPQAEQAVTLEGGWRRQFSSVFSLDTALFYSRYSHLSGARVTAMDSNAWQQAIAQAQACLNNPANYVSASVSRCYLVLPGYNSHQDRARSWGGEISSEWHVRPWWKMQAAYSHLHVVGTYTGDPLGDNLLRVTENSSPRHQLIWSNHWRVAPDWSLNMALRRQSGTLFFPLSRLGTQAEAIAIPAYTNLDLRLAWQYSRRLEWSIMGRNLLQERHTEFINSLPYTQALDVRRSIYMQAVLRF